MFTIKVIHVTKHDHEDDELLHNIWTHIKLIHEQNKQIMAKFSEIRASFDQLKQVVIDERTQANEKLNELQASIADLRNNIQNGGTEEERASLFTDINGAITDIRGIIPDPATPLPELPAEENPTSGEGNPGGTL